METLKKIRAELQELACPNQARVTRSFFKTKAGEYGAQDRFLGIKLPDLRRLAAQNHNLSCSQLAKLLSSPWHEHRFLGVLIIVWQYQNSATAQSQQQWYEFYLAQRQRINSWDLVDSSAPQVVGNHLLAKNPSILHQLFTAANWWERRIAMVATLTFIRAGQFTTTLQLAQIACQDSEALIHKASGWMLREVGKQDLRVLENFLNRSYRGMPRLMLRYAIERLSPSRRLAYLRGTI